MKSYFNLILLILIFNIIQLFGNERLSFGISGGYNYFSSDLSSDVNCLYFDCNENITTINSFGFESKILLNYELSPRIKLSLHTGIILQNQDYNGEQYLGKVYDNNFDLVDASFNDEFGLPPNNGTIN